MAKFGPTRQYKSPGSLRHKESLHAFTGFFQDLQQVFIRKTHGNRKGSGAGALQSLPWFAVMQEGSATSVGKALNLASPCPGPSLIRNKKT